MKNFKIGPVLVVLTMLGFMAVTLTMYWIASHNPPEVINKAEAWK